MAIYRGAGGPGDAITDAANEATVASNKATEAAASAAAAASSASSAASSSTSASASATSATASATSAAASASAAATSATAAASSASDANDSETAAYASQLSAETAQAAAETAQGLAEDAQAAAEAAQAAAELAQTGAETAETNAETAQAAAEAARDAALTALADFDDRYFGAFVDDAAVATYAAANGFTIDSGDLYFNTTTTVMKVYSGSAWLSVSVIGGGALDDISDVTITSLATGDILQYNGTDWVNSTDYATAAQGALADSAIQPADLATVATTGAYSDLTGTPTNVSTFTNDANYITTAEETDPVFSASEAATITSTDTTNWDTAYGWGNHASAGYLTSETYTGTVTNVDMTVPTGLTVSGNPVTGAGILAIDYDTGYSIPTTVKQGNWDDSYTFVAAFPSQTGNSGKYLTTDGTNLSFATVDALPDQTGHSGEFLTTDGSTASWASIATGNTTATGLWENANTITSNYTITTNYNAMSAGPVTIDTGVTVTVPTGSRWVVI